MKYLFSLMLMFAVNSLWATWSIIAVDPITGEVGSAGASWSPAVWMIVQPVPGKGMVVAQAATNIAAGELAASLLKNGERPNEIIRKISDINYDSTRDIQQYGIVSLNGDFSVFTGKDCPLWAGSASEKYVSVQGNTLAGSDVVNETLYAYLKAEKEGKPLVERLLLAMEAGSAKGGDIRSIPNERKSALTAYLIVVKPNDSPRKPFLTLIAYPAVKGENPINDLRKQFNSFMKNSNNNSVNFHPLYIPYNNEIWLYFVLVPILVSIIFAFVLRKWKAVLIPPVTAVILYSLIILLAYMINWVIPFNYYLAWGIPLFILIITFILSLFVMLLKAIIIFAHKRVK